VITLYPKQVTAVDGLRTAMRQHKSVFLQAACGFGKTVVLASICKSAAAKGKRVIFGVHRKELIQQTTRTFASFDLPHSYIAAGRHCDTSQTTHIASIPTLRNRLGKFPADLLIIDEAHLSMADGWQKVIAHYRDAGAYIIGCSASPQRLDGRGLKNNFGAMVRGPTVRWLMDNGYLSQYRLFAPSTPDLSHLHTLGGDYRKDEAAQLMNKPSITGDCVSHWLAHAERRKTVVYCCSIEHSKAVAADFRSRGVMAFHVDGDTPEEVRGQATRDLADGKLEVITNCQIFTEGVDLAALAGRDITIECVVNLRPTKSLALWTQICGRALRRKDKPALILDHAGCALNPELGLPDDDIEWELTDTVIKRKRDKDAGDISVRVCPKCFAAGRSGPPRCLVCGHVFEVKSRDVKEVAGELKELTPEEMQRRRLRKEQGRAQTLEDLLVIEKDKRYAPGWASHVYNARQKAAAKRMANQAPPPDDRQGVF
jgi:DNA repair protein RadD